MRVRKKDWTKDKFGGFNIQDETVKSNYFRHLERMKVKEIIKVLEDDGWYLVDQRGSHRQFKHALKSGRVTVAGKSSMDIPPGTLNSILKQSGLK